MYMYLAHILLSRTEQPQIRNKHYYYVFLELYALAVQ
jgi:hypothetical protein